MAAGLRALEERAAALAATLQSLVVQGDSTRKMALQMLIANGEHDTRRLEEAAGVTAPPALYLGVAKLLAEWIADVHATLKDSPPALTEGKRR